MCRFAWAILIYYKYKGSFPLQYLITKCSLNADTKEGHFDIYLRDALGGRSDWVIGIIYLKPDNKGNTIVKVGVQTIYDGPLFGEHGKYRRLWLRFAEGDSSCKP